MIADPQRARQDEAVALQVARLLGDEFMELHDDPKVIELLANADGSVFVDRLGSGKVEAAVRLRASDVEAVLNVIASHLGETLSPTSPKLQGEMPVSRFRKGRIQGYIPPRSPTGPGFAIRKHASSVFPLESYLDREALDFEQYDLLLQAIDEHKNILVAGGTRSGKTTFVNALIRKMVEQCPTERYVIVEDTAELQCIARDTVYLRTMPGETMGDVIKEVLRLRPDRAFCGEFRDAAAYHACDLWSTGHPGGAATTHANDALGALERTNRLALDGKEGCYRWLVGEAIDVVVVIQRTPVGGKVTDLAYVNGLDSSGRFILERPVEGNTRRMAS